MVVKSRGMSRAPEHKERGYENRQALLLVIDTSFAGSADCDYVVGTPPTKVRCSAEHADPEATALPESLQDGRWTPGSRSFCPHHLVHFLLPNAIACEWFCSFRDPRGQAASEGRWWKPLRRGQSAI